MAEIKKFLSRIKLVYKRSHTATKVMLILVLVLSMAALTAVGITTGKLQKETDELKNKASVLTAENQELTGDIAALGSVQSVVEIAEEELGLVQPGTVIFQPES